MRVRLWLVFSVINSNCQVMSFEAFFFFFLTDKVDQIPLKVQLEVELSGTGEPHNSPAPPGVGTNWVEQAAGPRSV